MRYSKEINRILVKLEPTARKGLRRSSFPTGKNRTSLIYESNLAKAVPIVKRALLKSTRLLKPRSNITFILTNTKDKFVTSKMGGASGFTLNYNLIHCRINTDADSWKQMLFGTVAHEFNHTVRQSVFEYDKDNLRCYLASEGLAQCFEVEVSGRIPPWSRALSSDEAVKVWKNIKPHLGEKGWKIYTRVFFGGRGKEFPAWAGYTISYLMVKKRLAELKVDWNKAMRLKPEDLIGS